MMQISQDCVVALTWVLTDTLGEQLDVLDEPLEFFLGGGDLLPAIEEVLQGHRAGDALQIQLEPDQAFGDFDDKLLFLEPRDLFPAELEVGLLIEGSALPKGCNPDVSPHALFTVTDIYPEHVVLDGNLVYDRSKDLRAKHLLEGVEQPGAAQQGLTDDEVDPHSGQKKTPAKTGKNEKKD